MRFKDIYEVDLECSCVECKTVHIVEVYGDGYIDDVAYAKCDICGRIKEYTEAELLRMI